MSDITLLGGEELKMKLSPHMFSFFSLYFTFFLLLLWGFWIYDFFARESFTTFPFYDFLINVPFVNDVTVGALCWSLALFIVGFAARYFFMDSGGQSIFLLYSSVAIIGILPTNSGIKPYFIKSSGSSLVIISEIVLSS